MKILRNLSLTVLCVFTTDIVCAGSQTTKLSRVGAATATYAIAFAESEPVVVPQCASTYRHEISWDKTTEHGKLMFSIALSAYLAGKSVYIQYDDTSCGLWGSRPLVTRIDVVD